MVFSWPISCTMVSTFWWSFIITRSCSSMCRSRNAIFVSSSWNDSVFIVDLLSEIAGMANAKLVLQLEKKSQLQSDPKDLLELNR